jgi:hypothetical protein
MKNKFENELKEACNPLLKLLNSKKYHPHMTVIVTSTSIELVEGVCSIPKIYEYIKDLKVNKG